ncbi:hypothetical protein V8E53_011335 [Lactarius tabidus]
MQPDGDDPELSDDHVSVDDGSESEGESDEGNMLEQDVEESADHLNQDIGNKLPFLAQVTRVPLSTSTPSFLPPPCHLMPHHHCNIVYLMKREESPPAIWICLPICPLALTVTICITRAPPRNLCLHCLSQTLETINERLTASEKRVTKLQCEVEKLEAYCVLSGGIITHLQKWINNKENKKKSSACAKKTTGEARVLTSEEGHQELQQLCEESWQKELHQNKELVWKATEDQAQCECRADSTHTFTGSLNKSRCKEELADIAAVLLLSDSGKKDDIFDRIVKEFDAHPELKTNPCFKGLFHSCPRKRAHINDGSGPLNLTSTPSSLPPAPHPGIGNSAPSNLIYKSPVPPCTGATIVFDGPAQYQPDTCSQYPYIYYSQT